MPFFLIPTALGVSFFLIWAFIGGMIFRDSQLAVQRDLDSDVPVPRYVPRVDRVPVAPPKRKRLQKRRRQFVA